jgi:hypothetical protein
MPREPTLAVKLYVLVVFASFIIAVVHLARFWQTARTRRRSQGNLSLNALQPLRNRARSLKQWMLLDCLAWSIATVDGLGRLVKGSDARRPIGLPLMLDVFWDLCQPLVLLLGVVLFLFLARWYMLWRIERFEMGINSTQRT